ncbi:type VII secretion-associated serine protease mycosin [Catellatospora sp. NPDC049609]|uniref:type VII secretion-associated serine protease mycosin n=1 Tax=Catellatospora sp. NPDC049609 TaxID=3155505 RepID=UPI00341A9A73
MHRTRTPAAMAVLTVVLTFGAVGISTTPAAAAPCSGSGPSAGEPIYAEPWAQKRFNLSALPPGIDGSGIVVAVLDSGSDARNPQLRGAVEPGRDLLPDGGTDGTQDCVGHGTGVASVIAARQVEGVAFRGIAPGAKILPLRVSERIGGQNNGRQAGVAGMAAAVRFAIDKKVDVINLSLTYNERQDVLEDFRQAIREAIAADIVVVAAVGNDKQRNNPTPYPASWEGVLGVGAVDETGQRLQASQTGPYVDLTAPGDQVTVARAFRGHGKESGTSFAAPMVAGTVALVRQAYPKLTEEQVRRRLMATADPAPGGRRSDDYGVGILNPVRAVNEILDGQPRASVAPLAPPAVDPAAVAAAARAEQAHARSLWLAALGLVLAGFVLALAVALPNGIRRRWRPAGS